MQSIRVRDLIEALKLSHRVLDEIQFFVDGRLANFESLEFTHAHDAKYPKSTFTIHLSSNVSSNKFHPVLTQPSTEEQDQI